MWTKMAAWKNLDFDFGVHKNHPTRLGRGFKVYRAVSMMTSFSLIPPLEGLVQGHLASTDLARPALLRLR